MPRPVAVSEAPVRARSRLFAAGLRLWPNNRNPMRILRLPYFITRRLRGRCDALMRSRPPDREVHHTDGTRYLLRWYLFRGAGPAASAGAGRALYLHAFHGSDVGRLHDHPWPSISLILHGEYMEHVPADPRAPAGPTRALRRRPGDVIVRRARDPHRVEIPADEPVPVVSLFAVGRRRRRWGFWCPQGWRDGPAFKQAARRQGDRGAGCE